MAKAIFGNHSSVIVPLQNRDSIRRFYCDVLGGTITKEESNRDFLRLGENFYIVFLYGRSRMRASSSGVQGRSGWKSSLTMWRT
jgi:hypothetical protein